MEKISGELGQMESEKEILFKAYNQAQSQASSVLLFTLQWKDLEERFDGIRKSLECYAKELDESKRLLAERAYNVELREEGLRLGWQRVEEREEEAQRKKMNLRSVEMRLEECRVENRNEESQLIVRRDALRECISLIRDKKKELSLLERRIEERDKEVTVKAGKLQSLEDKVNDRRAELKAKEEELREIHKYIEKRSKELESKESQLHSINILIEEQKTELKSKKKHDAPLLGQTLGLVNETTAPASIPASLSRVRQQPPREKNGSASDTAIDVQSQPCARKCNPLLD